MMTDAHANKVSIGEQLTDTQITLNHDTQHAMTQIKHAHRIHLQ